MNPTCVVVELSLNIGKAVDTRDDLSSVLTKTVKDNAEWVLTNLVSHLSDLNCALSSCERLVTSEECEALSLLTEKTCSEVTVTDTYKTIVSN